jgi:hypothetical protein
LSYRWPDGIVVVVARGLVPRIIVYLTTLQLWRHGAGAGAASNPASTEDFKLGRCPLLRHGFSGDQQVAVTLVSERTIGPTKPALRDSLKRMGVRLLATGETREGAAGLDSVR